MSIVASHSVGKVVADKIFGAGASAKQAISKFGREKVVNGAQGVLLDDQEKIVCLTTVEKVLRSLPVEDLIGYAPIKGLPEFLGNIIPMTFGEYQPEAHIRAVATSGGTGALHHAIWNYSEVGDTVLTTDWFWSPYRVLCQEVLRKLAVFQLLDEQGNFNFSDFAKQTASILERQDHLLVILNTPAHNPTGYSLSLNDWEAVLGLCREYAKDKAKKITLVVDVAYLDFAGGANGRQFFSKFTGLPDNVLIILAASMSKSFTMYGQRTGAMIGISANKQEIDEFVNVNEYTSRATWSNVNRGAMKTLAVICQDQTLLRDVQQERNAYLKIVEKRASIFSAEAKRVDLTMLPYRAGFFMTVPVSDPDQVCAELQTKNIFLVPLDKGVRIAVCAIPTSKISGLAMAVKNAITTIGE
jgi:aromatic-amino-acid transaminase